MTKNSKRYFLQRTGAAIVWDPVKNEILAQATGGVFCTVINSVAKRLKELGYREAFEAELSDLGLDVPKVPDRVDYTVRDSKRYQML